MLKATIGGRLVARSGRSEIGEPPTGRPVADIDGSLRFFAAIVMFKMDAGV
jgi:hypothetical protein